MLPSIAWPGRFGDERIKPSLACVIINAAWLLSLSYNCSISKEEHELLTKFRKIRNKIEHGTKPDEPSMQEIKRVKALTNRIILASLKQAKANTQASKQHPDNTVDYPPS